MLVHVPDDKKQTWEFTVELKLAGETTDSRNKASSEATKFFLVMNFFLATELFFVAAFSSVTKFLFVTEFFVVAKFFFVTGTIVPIPIRVPVFLWKPA
jgi:hypothetical protein